MKYYVEDPKTGQNCIYEQDSGGGWNRTGNLGSPDGVRMAPDAAGGLIDKILAAHRLAGHKVSEVATT